MSRNVFSELLSRLARERERKEREMEEEADIDFYLIELELGEGPMRFAGKGERPLERQLQDLSEKDRQCYRNLKRRSREQRNSGCAFPCEIYLRFARNTSGKKGFNEQRAWKHMTKFNNKRYLNLSAHRLEKQLLTKTLFPVPGLKTKGGHGMFYMRPSRYVPNETSTETIIDNLAYTIHTMLEKERPCQDGIGFLACMDGWTMKNFDVDYCFQFMMTLQGYVVPVRVHLFLIVNPPSWFGAIWKIMKPMLAPAFRKRVKMITERDLHRYLQEGYQTYLPDEMESGQANTDDLVEDFVNYRKYLDELNPNFVEEDVDVSEI